MSNPSYDDLARMARAAHLVGKDYRPSMLTRGQKSHLTKLYNRFEKVMQAPDEYHIRKIGKKTQKRLKNSEHQIINDRLVLKKSSAKEKLHIKTRKDYVVIKTSRESNRGKHEAKTIIHDDPTYIFRQIDRFRKQMKNGGFDPEDLMGSDAPYVQITARIGKNAPFSQRFDAVSALEEYLSKFSDSLLRYMTLEKFTFEDAYE